MPTSRVNIIVVADAAQAEAAIARLGAVTGASGVQAEKAAVQNEGWLAKLAQTGPLGQVASNAISNVTGSFSGKLGPASKEAQAALAGVGAETEGVAASSSAALGPIAAVAVGLAAEAVIVKKSVDAFGAYAEQVDRVQQVTEASAQDSSKLVGAMGLVGVQTDAADAAFGRLAKSIGAGTLAKYGIEVAKNADGTTNFVGTLGNVADAYKTQTDAGARAAEETALFGRGWQTLIPLLKDGSAGLNALYAQAAQSNPLLSESDIQSARDLKIATASLHDEFSKLEIELGSAVAPALSGAAQGFSTLVRGVEDADRAVPGLSTAFKALNTVVNPLWSALGALGLAHHNNASAAEANKTATDAATQAQQDYQAAVQASESAVQAYTSAATGVVNDQLNAAQAALRLEQVKADWEAQNAQQAAQQRAAIAAAQQALADAEHSRAQQEQQDEQAVADVRRQAARTALDDANTISDAARNVADVERTSAASIVSAKQTVLAAEQALSDLENKSNNDARNLADAKLKLARVEEDIGSGKLTGVDATRQYQDAETALERVQQDNAANEQARTEAISNQKLAVKNARTAEVAAEQQAARDIASAKRSLARDEVRANQDRADSAIALARAEQRAAQDRVDADQKVADAVKNLAKAQDASGPSWEQLYQHNLDVQSATLANDAAQQTLRTDVKNLADGIQDGKYKFEDIKRVIDGLNLKQFPTLNQQIQAILTDLQLLAPVPIVGTLTVPAVVAGARPATVPGSALQGGSPHRASGGPVSAGHLYQVNENGVELFRPSVDGTIVPHPGQGAGGGASFPSSVTVNVTIAAGNGVVFLDHKSADLVGRQVADGVHKALLQRQSSGEDLRLTGRR